MQVRILKYKVYFESFLTYCVEYVREIFGVQCKVKSHRNVGRNERMAKELDEVDHGIDNSSKSNGSNTSVNNKNRICSSDEIEWYITSNINYRIT